MAVVHHNAHVHVNIDRKLSSCVYGRVHDGFCAEDPLLLGLPLILLEA